jgi:hypothetical protein
MVAAGVIGGVIGWVSHVGQVAYADRREERQLRVTLGNRASALLTDLGAVWKDIKDGETIDDRRIHGLESGIAKIETVLERVTVIRDAGTRDRLTLWYSLLRGVPDDVRLFNDRSPLPSPCGVRGSAPCSSPAHREGARGRARV